MGALPDFDQQSFTRALEKLTARVKELEQRSPYAGTGMRPNGADGIVIDGDLIVDGGDAQSGNYSPATAGWRLGGDGTAEFKDVLLYDIPNSMLANPVVPGVVNLTSNNFSVGVPWVDVVSTSLTVPDGCTRLLMTSSVWLQLFNTKTTGGADGNGSDYIYTRVVLASTTGMHTSTGVSGNSGTATATSGMSALLTGLTPGGSVSLAGQGSTDYTIATSTFNKAVLTATLFWLR